MRLIPAGAGKTAEKTGVFHTGTAHPRRCGENGESQIGDSASFGSSPQVRGKRLSARHAQPSGRLIPAGAGKTAVVLAGSPGAPAHPRRCGENNLDVLAGDPLIGSSPQVRGKPEEGG